MAAPWLKYWNSTQNSTILLHETQSVFQSWYFKGISKLLKIAQYWVSSDHPSGFMIISWWPISRFVYQWRHLRAKSQHSMRTLKVATSFIDCTCCLSSDSLSCVLLHVVGSSSCHHLTLHEHVLQWSLDPRPQDPSRQHQHLHLVLQLRLQLYNQFYVLKVGGPSEPVTGDFRWPK